MVIDDSAGRSVWSRVWPPRRVHYFVVGGVIALIAVTIAVLVVVNQLSQVTVPNLAGKAPAEAIAEIEAAGLVYEPDEAESDVVCTTDPPLYDHCEVTGQSVDAESRISRGTTLVLSIEVIDVTIPTFTGLTYDEAAKLAAESFLLVKPDSDVIRKISGFGEWEVLKQSREADEVVEAGMVVELSLDTPLVDVPRVVGMPFRKAIEALEAVGLVGGFSSIPASDERLFVRAANPAPAAGQQPIGSQVNLEWGYKVPAVLGLTEGEAVRMLEAAGLRAGGNQYGSEIVSKQNPAAGSIVNTSKPVDLTLEPPTVVYEVVGDGSRASITWIAPGTYNISQATDARLPWKMTFDTDESPENFNAQIMNGSKVTCNIYVNGKLLKTNTSTGRYAVVGCG